MKRYAKLLSASAMAMMFAAPAMAELKIAFIDTLSGPQAPGGEVGIAIFRHVAERINAAGGIQGEMVEIVGMDNKGSPRDSLVQLQYAIDAGVRYVTQANGSAVSAALIGAIEKHNARNPGEEVVFLNWGASAPELTESGCSFWHFRFAPHSRMIVAGMVEYLRNRDDVKKVYLINQDYVNGRAFATEAIERLKEARPDIEVVGDEYHPLVKVKDFSPYVQKIIAAEPDVVMTSNWGQDMVLLVKSAADAGLKADFLTMFGGSIGTVGALGEAAVGNLFYINSGVANLPASPEHKALVTSFEDKYPEYDYIYHQNLTLLEMLKAAADKAGSTDPIPVAQALEGLEFADPYGKVVMRAEDHQLVSDLFVSVVSADVEIPVDKTSWGWKPLENATIPMALVTPAIECEMKRPD